MRQRRHHNRLGKFAAPSPAAGAARLTLFHDEARDGLARKGETSLAWRCARSAHGDRLLRPELRWSGGDPARFRRVIRDLGLPGARPAMGRLGGLSDLCAALRRGKPHGAPPVDRRCGAGRLDREPERSASGPAQLGRRPAPTASARRRSAPRRELKRIRHHREPAALGLGELPEFDRLHDAGTR
jgi:hypothetical protein